ncbi:hypothetical protein A8C32_14635 [Flavivirga aquatica]|uniref:Secretion system C-terminal sorting domain-containing protein n=1 Tax=Flavivirga aquatica TaxID=1849968 RepID=A0A1E5TC28_9FLAO|nr:T9SS type A sorting domain-containing protein [Flavivirga aquatica]OEK08922.1 hypothetical protein A8C32_14635 [Flavivirga aquatica]
MKYLKSILILIVFTFFNFSYSQTGPGGVGSNDGSSNLVLWLNADDITGTNGSTITNWTDSSGNNYDFTVGNGATFNTATVNGYPAFNFDGTNDYFERAFTSNITPAEFTIFSSTNVNSSTSYKAVISNRDDPSGSETRGFILYSIPNNNNWQFWTGRTNNPWQSTTGGTSTAGNWAGQTLQYTTAATNNKTLYINGSLDATSTHTMASNTVRPIRIGAGRNEITPNYYFNGDIGEVIMYDTDINAAQRIIVDNYLSAKYNYSLAANDLYTQDNPANGNFDHDVAGIGQVASGIRHRNSQGTGIVRISNPSALSDGDYLFWGEETKDPTYNFYTNTTNYYEQLNSKWRVSKINDLGTVRVRFFLHSIDLTDKPSCQPLQLVVDNDSNFSSPTVYNLTINSSETRATVSNVTFNDGDYFTLRYLDQIVWDGTNFFNGSGTENAPGNTDSCLKFTIKSGAAGILNNNANVREIEIETGGTISVSSGISISVENQVVINGVMNLLGEAQLIQNHSTTTSNSGSGYLSVNQQGSSNLHNYNYWSSPVNNGGSWQIGDLEDANGVINFNNALNANANTTPITLSSRWLYSFNGLSNTYSQWNSLSDTSNLLPGIGYTMKGSGTASPEQEYIFKGIPNDGNYSYPAIANNDFLVGNPYPSALNADQFINDNSTVIDGTLYFWEHFTSNSSHYLADYEGGYATYNLMMPTPAVADNSGLTSGDGYTSKAAPTSNIPIGQGFFVTIANSGNLVFNNQQRIFARESLSEAIFYKSSLKNKITASSISKDKRSKIWFSFKEPKNITKIIGLGYDTKASMLYDSGYDAKAYDDLRNDINWILGENKLVVQALPKINIDDELPLSIKVTDPGIYKFSIDKMQYIPDTMNVFLKDNHKNIYYNLRQDEAQVLLDNVGNHAEFSIVFKEDTILNTAEFSNDNFFTTYNAETKLLELHNIDNLINIETLSIYSVLGQKIMHLNSLETNTINISNLSNGIYILKVNTKSHENSISYKFSKY